MYCNVASQKKKKAHKVPRVFLWSLIHSSPLSCTIFILEKKKKKKHKGKKK